MGAELILNTNYLNKIRAPIMIYIPNRPGSRIPGALESRFFFPGVGGGVLPEKLAGGVRPASQNPYHIYD